MSRLTKFLGSTAVALLMLGISSPAYAVDGDGWEFDETTGVLTVYDDIEWNTESSSGTVMSWQNFRSLIKKIVFDDEFSQETIGYGAFEGCYTVSSVSIPSSVKEIGKRAFYECKAMTTVTIPDDSGLTSILGYAFYNCETLKKMTLPATATSIGEYAFYNCAALTSINLPEGMTTVNKYAFSGTTSLASITLPSTLATVWYGAFYNSGIETLVIPSPNFNISYNGYSGYNGSFESCKKLTTVTFPAECEEVAIGYAAFKDCDLLKTVVFPTSCTIMTIGESAFASCTALESVTFPTTCTSASLAAKAFYNTGIKSIEIPAYVSIIGNEVFESCGNLTTAKLMEGFRFVCRDTVGYYDNYDGVLPLYVQSYGKYKVYGYDDPSYTFSNCKSLTSVALPSTVTSLPSSTFKGCSSLPSVDLSYVETVGGYAFSDCASLAKATFKKKVTKEIGNYAFYNCRFSTLRLLTGLETVGDYAFAENKNMTKITFPTGTSIGNYCLQNCTALESISFPTNITAIPRGVCKGDVSLETIWFLGKVTTINECAFQNCSSLEYVIIPKYTIIICDYAFDGCTGLQYVEIEPDETRTSQSQKIYLGSYSNYYSSGNNVFPDFTDGSVPLRYNSEYTWVGNVSNNLMYYFSKTEERTAIEDVSETEEISVQGNVIMANDGIVGIYDLAGRKYSVGKPMPRGIYAVVSKSGTRKVLIK